MLRERSAPQCSLYQMYLGKVLPVMFVAFWVLLFSGQYLDLNASEGV